MAVIDFSVYSSTWGFCSGGGPALICSTRALIPSVVFGRGPGDELAGVGARGEHGFGKRRAEDGQRVVRRNGTGLAFQHVHGDGLAAGQIAFDVDLVQDRLDRRLVGRAGIGGQAAGIFGVGSEFRQRDRGGQHAQGGRGQDVLQRVHRGHGGFLRRRPGVQTIDQGLDLFVILGRGPGDELVGFGAGQEAGARKGLGQQADRVSHRRGGRLPLEPIDGRRRASAAFAFGVDLGQHGLDLLVVGGAGQRGQPLRIGRVGGKRRFGERRRQDGGRGRRGDPLQRVQRHLGRVFRRRSGVHLFDQGFDPGVILGSGPGNKLVGFGAHGERGFRERRAKDGQGVVQPSGGRRAFELVDADGGIAAGIALDVDLLQDLLDRRLVGRAGVGGQAVSVLGVGTEFGLGDGGGQQGQRGGGRDVLQGVHRGLGRLLRRRSDVQTVHQGLDLLLILGGGPSDELAGFRAQQEAGAGKACVNRLSA